MQNWQAQLLRLTIFTQSDQLNPQLWWDEVVGEAPDTINSQPKLQRFLAESNYGLGKLTLKTQPDRVDWIYAAVEPGNPQEIASLGEYEEALKIFLEISSRWFKLKGIPSGVRVAYGCILIQPAEDRPSAYEILDSFLPSVNLDKNSSDFVYQINRPRELEFSALKIKVNRLSKWATGANIQQDIVLSEGRPFRGKVTLLSLYSKLELDINTTPEFTGVIDTDTLPLIFNSLTELGDEIATNGDIP